MRRKIVTLVMGLAICNAFTNIVYADDGAQVFVDGQRMNNTIIQEGKAYVGVKELADKTDYNVEYNAVDNTVNFYKRDGEKPKVARDYSLFPVNVVETTQGDTKRIIKTYELSNTDNPAGIPKENFQQGDYEYSLTDITRNDKTTSDSKEQVETITISTSNNDTNTILSQLKQEMEYKSEDGYVGVLKLDISTVKTVSGGSKKSSYTVTETRDIQTYPLKIQALSLKL